MGPTYRHLPATISVIWHNKLKTWSMSQNPLGFLRNAAKSECIWRRNDGMQTAVPIFFFMLWQLKNSLKNYIGCEKAHPYSHHHSHQLSCKKRKGNRAGTIKKSDLVRFHAVSTKSVLVQARNTNAKLWTKFWLAREQAEKSFVLQKHAQNWFQKIAIENKESFGSNGFSWRHGSTNLVLRGGGQGRLEVFSVAPLFCNNSRANRPPPHLFPPPCPPFDVKNRSNKIPQGGLQLAHSTHKSTKHVTWP